MNSKVERPTLQGQRIRTRKRDEKEKYDPAAFRDSILQGFQESLNQLPSPVDPVVSSSPPTTASSEASTDNVQVVGVEEKSKLLKNGSSASSTPTHQPAVKKAQFDAIYKFLDSSGSKLDYRRYGDVLFDILIAGGILAPGGTIVADSDPTKPHKTDFCVFASASDDIETIREFSQVIVKLVRRFMYLEKTLEEEFKRIIVFLKGFNPEDRIKLAKITALLISGGLLSPTVLTSALTDHFIKDGIAIDFLMAVLRQWCREKDAATVWASMKKSSLDVKVMNFLPVSKRSTEYLQQLFLKNDLSQLLEFQKAGLSVLLKKELQAQVAEALKENVGFKEIATLVKDASTKNGLTEQETVILVWNTLMSNVEWNKKEELVAEQALKHLKGHSALLSAFTTTAKSQLALMNRIQEYCYDNMNFLKVFQKIIVLFYKTDVLSEDAIHKWYRTSHSNKGKSVFLAQMEPFVEWLQNAEEESGGED